VKLVVQRVLPGGLVDEAELALVVVGEGELVGVRALGHEPALQLRTPGVPAMTGVRVAAALPLRGAEGRGMTGGHLIPGRVGEGLLLNRVGVRAPPEVVVERPVLHHHEHEVVDRQVARIRQRRAAGGRLGGLREDRARGQARGHAGKPGGIGRAL
jgi:hypothetical protein